MDERKKLLEMDKKEEQGMDRDEQLKHPIIVVMKGHPCTGKTTIAQKLALFLRYPLLIQNDLLDYAISLQQSLPLSSSNISEDQLSNMSFEAIYPVASTHLSLGIRIIIDSPLHHRAHWDRLVKLAKSTRARVIIVECRCVDEYEWRQRLEYQTLVDNLDNPSTWQYLENLVRNYDEGYDIGASHKLVVDTTKRFDVGFIAAASRSIPFYQNTHVMELDLWEDLMMKSEFCQEHNGVPYSHSHKFGPSNNQIYARINCKLCDDPLSGPFYKCDQCEFVLLKSCAELPDNAQRLSDEYPPFLIATPPEYFSFPEKHPCVTPIEMLKEASPMIVLIASS